MDHIISMDPDGFTVESVCSHCQSLLDEFYRCRNIWCKRYGFNQSPSQYRATWYFAMDCNQSYRATMTVVK